MIPAGGITLLAHSNVASFVQAASITGITNGFSHLNLKVIAQQATLTSSTAGIQINGDTNAHYYSQFALSVGTTFNGANNLGTATSATFGYMSSTNFSTLDASTINIWIDGYTNGFLKQIRSDPYGFMFSAVSPYYFNLGGGGRWSSNAVVNSITVTSTVPWMGTMDLYGVK